MADAVFAGLLGYLIGRGISPLDAQAIVKALQEYLGFEPPLGLTGYALEDMEQGQKKNACVLVRGKAYDAIALEAVLKYSEISVLGKQNGYLQIAPTIQALKVIETIKTLEAIEAAISVSAVQAAIDIKTSGAANILIDKLTQTAQYPWRHYVQNYGEYPTNWYTATATAPRAKLFARGMRGMLLEIAVYAKNTTVGTKNITLKLGYAFESWLKTMTRPIAYPFEGWISFGPSVLQNYDWQYDRMIIEYYADSADVQFGADVEEPVDGYYIYGGYWTPFPYRPFVRVYIDSTIGDLPVSGELNSIEIPSATTVKAQEAITANPGAVELRTITGVGELVRLEWYVGTRSARNNLQPAILVDEDTINSLSHDTTFEIWQSQHLHQDRYSPLGWGKWDETNDRYTFACTLPLSFLHQIRYGISCLGTAPEPQGSLVSISVKLKR